MLMMLRALQILSHLKLREIKSRIFLVFFFYYYACSFYKHLGTDFCLNIALYCSWKHASSVNGKFKNILFSVECFSYSAYIFLSYSSFQHLDRCHNLVGALGTVGHGRTCTCAWVCLCMFLCRSISHEENSWPKRLK